MIMGVLYVDYNVKAISFRIEKKQEKGKEVLEMITQDSSCECRVVNTPAFPRVNLVALRIFPRVIIRALALIK